MAPTRKRRTRSKTSSSEIVAPGGGTQADVNKLAHTLGLESDSVAEILSCGGSGIASERTSRSNSSGLVTDKKAVASSAWADFMADDGEGGDASKTTEKEGAADANGASGSGTRGSTKASTAESQNKRAKIESDVKAYDLPILPRMRPPSDTSTDPSKYVTPGVLAMTGTLDAKMVGRTKRTLKETYDLQEPTVLGLQSVFEGKHVGAIITASTACHSIVITKDGDAYAWGRNESGQCGFGTTTANVPFPKKIEMAGNLDGKFVGGAVGKSHSILIDESGVCYAVGWNKYGQCGVNTSNEAVSGWRKCTLASASDAKIVQVSSNLVYGEWYFLAVVV